jgi:hypothetical protein
VTAQNRLSANPPSSLVALPDRKDAPPVTPSGRSSPLSKHPELAVNLLMLAGVAHSVTRSRPRLTSTPPRRAIGGWEDLSSLRPIARPSRPRAFAANEANHLKLTAVAGIRAGQPVRSLGSVRLQMASERVWRPKTRPCRIRFNLSLPVGRLLAW